MIVNIGGLCLDLLIADSRIAVLPDKLGDVGLGVWTACSWVYLLDGRMAPETGGTMITEIARGGENATKQAQTPLKWGL